MAEGSEGIKDRGMKGMKGGGAVRVWGMRLLAAGVVGGVDGNAELMVPGWVSAWCAGGYLWVKWG